MIRITLLCLTFTLLAGCSAIDPLGPRLSLEGLPQALDVQFTIEPDEVAQHESFTVRLTVTNRSSIPTQVVTAHGCLVIPHVLRNGNRIPFVGSWWGCFAAITTHTFAPGESKEHTWEMKAELYGQHTADVAGAPAPKGSYIVRVEFDTFREGAPSEKPKVEGMLTVR